MAPPWDEEGFVDDGLLGDGDLLADAEDDDDEWAEGEDLTPGFRASLFSSQAAHYAAYRPLYPPEVYERIYNFAAAAAAAQGQPPGSSGQLPGSSQVPGSSQGSRQLAVDVGCGPGNVAIELAKAYAQVIGVDPSQHQLSHAYQRPNVRYICIAAEYLHTQLPPQSVDLIAMAETLHWIEHVKFYEMARRVLKPTGTLAIWCYDLCEFRALGPNQTAEGLAQANGIMRAFTYGTMGPFWDERRRYIDRRYRGLEPDARQFATVTRDETEMEKVLSLAHYMGFLSSWSPYAAYRTTFPNKEDPLTELREQFRKLLAITDDSAPSMRVVWPVFFLLCRDPVQ